ncbi:GNAT family N-acetyltransferase [Shewanella surugensis]|uniref:GNAT family N-acetyltransferase n=1 Tax=Shewanella surugensis TaxID=212020 RepID=A0ABT0L7J7_9GAMM|nr:GNAT family N-acetyltransferase [Shewanella surugensis]MCL1123370.1 GNAT family N-acetyltransferase [Shewanella surugensis]
MNEIKQATKHVIHIREYCPTDAIHTWALFFNTIRHVNIRDYSLKQVTAWAPDEFDLGVWQQKMAKIKPFIAEINGVIVGYADLQVDGYIDHFFCHHEYQGQGVGKALMTHILTQSQLCGIRRCYSDVSITAKPFYKHLGFQVLKQQEVIIRGEKLTHYKMGKAV